MILTVTTWGPGYRLGSTQGPKGILDLLSYLDVGTYLKLKDNVIKWGAIDFNPLQSMEFIDNKYDGFCMDIDQCILGFLLARGDPATIRDLNSLKERLRIIRRQAVAAIQDAQAIDDPETRPTNPLHLETTQMNQAMSRSVNLDNVFRDNPEEVPSSLNRTLPINLPSPRGDPDLSSSRIAALPENISGTTVVASRLDNRIIALNTGSTYARQYMEPEKSKLCDLIGTYSNKSIAWTIYVDLSQSLTDILAGIPGVYSNPQVGIDVISNCTDS